MEREQLLPRHTCKRGGWWKWLRGVVVVVGSVVGGVIGGVSGGDALHQIHQDRRVAGKSVIIVEFKEADGQPQHHLIVTPGGEGRVLDL